MRAKVAGALLLLPGLTAAAEFDHAAHVALVEPCAACHPGGAEAGASLWPSPQSCTACHDGSVRERADWSPPPAATSNVRFGHALHAEELTCVECHAGVEGTNRPERRPQAAACLDCHGEDGPHLAQPDAECATCHRPLSEAAGLTREQVAAFARPPSHGEPGFSSRGHGALACPAQGSKERVAASCAICHSRDFCMICHVDAPERDPILALAPDARSLVHRAALAAPADHGGAAFLRVHGHALGGDPARCATCHTRESCEVCHVATPEVAAALPFASPDRGTGALVRRRAPEHHDATFRETHGAMAAADPMECAACHSRQQCLECHLGDPAQAPPGYHPPDFVARHPSAAYARETSCSDCHNPQSFCATCHEESGLADRRSVLASGYHDAKRSFLFGHGPAARRNLESCVTCHTERDCLVCHSAVQGRGFNPHGPGFDAERLRSRATQMCTVCHGGRIPAGK